MVHVDIIWVHSSTNMEVEDRAVELSSDFPETAPEALGGNNMSAQNREQSDETEEQNMSELVVLDPEHVGSWLYSN